MHQTMKVVVSRDVVWMNQCYGDWKGISKNNYTFVEALMMIVTMKSILWIRSLGHSKSRKGLEVDEGNNDIVGVPNPDPEPNEEDVDADIIE
jgi:hypothetical protein